MAFGYDQGASITSFVMPAPLASSRNATSAARALLTIKPYPIGRIFLRGVDRYPLVYRPRRRRGGAGGVLRHLVPALEANRDAAGTYPRRGAPEPNGRKSP